MYKGVRKQIKQVKREAVSLIICNFAFTTNTTTQMIKIYGMATCPDCTYVDEQVKGNGKYDVIDIGAHVKYMKEFLRLRDANPAFDAAKRSGAVGIPCFVLEDGTMTLRPEDAGLRSRSNKYEGAACSLDGSGC